MRRGYWMKIGLGMAMIFALGLTVVSVVQAGKSKLRSMLATVGGRIPTEITDLPFRLSGRHLGNLAGVEVHRASARSVGDVIVKVQLLDPSFQSEILDCNVAALPIRHLKRSSRARFRCAEPAEIAQGGGLAQLGEIIFEPGGVRRPLYLTDHDLERWIESDIRSLDANLVRDANGGVRATGRFDMTPHRGRPERGTFDLDAGEHGARFVVRDERGREVVKFNAGNHGVSIKVR
jgi:hypothetical protein